MVRKIISGAQTGADRGGLEAAVTLRIERGGTVPRGRRTDVGPLSNDDMARFRLSEHFSSAYPPRTLCNVTDSDGTVLFGDITSPGTKLTIRYCTWYHRPYIVNPSVDELRQWVADRELKVINVAGNRERTNPGIERRVHDILVEALGKEGRDVEQ